MCNNDLYRKRFIEALEKYHCELERISPEADYEELFREIFGFSKDDVQQLQNIDFSNFFRATAIVDGMRLSLETTRQLIYNNQKMELAKRKMKKEGSVFRKLFKFLRIDSGSKT